MTKYTLKQLKNLVASGVAVDITLKYDYPRISGLSQIGYSAGTYGLNGALLQGADGKLYAITARTTALFIYC